MRTSGISPYLLVQIRWYFQNWAYYLNGLKGHSMTYHLIYVTNVPGKPVTEVYHFCSTLFFFFLILEEFYETAKAGERQPATELQEKLNLSSKLRPVETVMGINRGWKACCDQVEDTKASLKSLSDCNLATDGEISPPVDPPSDLIKVGF